jgi:hypothetical protein
VAEDPYNVVRMMARQVSNWGRWGPDDERGTLNLIDREAARRGAAAVRTGEGFALGLQMSLDGPQCGLPPERFNPRHYMTAIGQPAGEHPGFHFSDDVITLPPQCATQCDALSHVHYDGKLYNGFNADDVLTEKGASRLGIDKQAAQPLATRGLLLDFPRLWGVDRLAPGTPITAQHLDDALRSSGVELASGDALLLRTGHLNVFLQDGDRRTYNFTAPGLTLSAAPWLRTRRRLRGLRHDLGGSASRRGSAADLSAASAADQGHGDAARGDVQSGASVAGLRGRWPLGLLLHRPTYRHQERHRLADEPAGHPLKRPVSPVSRRQVRFSVRCRPSSQMVFAPTDRIAGTDPHA